MNTANCCSSIVPKITLVFDDSWSYLTVKHDPTNMKLTQEKYFYIRMQALHCIHNVQNLVKLGMAISDLCH